MGKMLTQHATQGIGAKNRTTHPTMQVPWAAIASMLQPGDIVSTKSDDGWGKRTCLTQCVCERTRDNEGCGRGNESESSERFEVHGDLEMKGGGVRRCFILVGKHA